jgi:hypothetical protein
MTLARDGGDEISDKQAVRLAIANIEATGEFSDACRDWWKKSEDEQTLAIFKTHFKKADTERQRQATSASAGFQSGNLSQTKLDAYCTSKGDPKRSLTPTVPVKGNNVRMVILSRVAATYSSVDSG